MRNIIVCYNFYQKKEWKSYFKSPNLDYIIVKSDDDNKIIIINLPCPKNEASRKDIVNKINQIVEQINANGKVEKKHLILLHNNPTSIHLEKEFEGGSYVWFDGNNPVLNTVLYTNIINAQGIIRHNRNGELPLLEISRQVFDNIWINYFDKKIRGKLEYTNIIVPFLLDVQSILNCKEMSRKICYIKEMINDYDFEEINEWIKVLRNNINRDHIPERNVNYILDHLIKYKKIKKIINIFPDKANTEIENYLRKNSFYMEPKDYESYIKKSILTTLIRF